MSRDAAEQMIRMGLKDIATQLMDGSKEAGIEPHVKLNAAVKIGSQTASLIEFLSDKRLTFMPVPMDLYHEMENHLLWLVTRSRPDGHPDESTH